MLGTLFFISAISCPNSSGIAYPTVSGTFMVFAPASITASNTLNRKSLSDLNASSAENSTSSVKFLANFTAETALSNTCSGVILSLYCICIGEVAINV